MDDYLGPIQGNNTSTHQIIGQITGQSLFSFTCIAQDQALTKGSSKMTVTLNTDNICDGSSRV